jgi:hypothetical protein
MFHTTKQTAIDSDASDSFSQPPSPLGAFCMDGVIIGTDFVDGREPIRRTAKVRDALLVTAYGNPEEDRWVLGWRVAARSKWQEIFLVALSHALRLQGSKGGISGYTVFDGQFEEVATLYERRRAALDMVSQIHLKLARRQPEMLVLNSHVFQLEVLFEPESSDPKILTVLTTSSLAHQMARLVYRWHLDINVRQHRISMSRVLDDLCSNNVKG